MADTVDTSKLIKFGYTDKDTLPASFTNQYPAYIVMNTKKNSVMFSDGTVTNEIIGETLNATTVGTITGDEPTWDATKGCVV